MAEYNKAQEAQSNQPLTLKAMADKGEGILAHLTSLDEKQLGKVLETYSSQIKTGSVPTREETEISAATRKKIIEAIVTAADSSDESFKNFLKLITGLTNACHNQGNRFLSAPNFNILADILNDYIEKRDGPQLQALCNKYYAREESLASVDTLLEDLNGISLHKRSKELLLAMRVESERHGTEPLERMGIDISNKVLFKPYIAKQTESRSKYKKLSQIEGVYGADGKPVRAGLMTKDFCDNWVRNVLNNPDRVDEASISDQKDEKSISRGSSDGAKEEAKSPAAAHVENRDSQLGHEAEKSISQQPVPPAAPAENPESQQEQRENPAPPQEKGLSKPMKALGIILAISVIASVLTAIATFALELTKGAMATEVAFIGLSVGLTAFVGIGGILAIAVIVLLAVDALSSKKDSGYEYAALPTVSEPGAELRSDQQEAKRLLDNAPSERREAKGEPKAEPESGLQGNPPSVGGSVIDTDRSAGHILGGQHGPGLLQPYPSAARAGAGAAPTPAVAEKGEGEGAVPPAQP